jgi:biotin carboxyl carrier protein
MKMEIPIVAPSSGTIKEIKVTVGQAVEAEQALATIE